ncbi:hypothetical protein [Pseudomonas vancouverensis]|uniref:Glycosyltransferase RgtA/B/C/D-like domain-containing protein n=1 Tax=Pseudomonas vancouverensis TaxID=95300 RepID=A0A1H2MH37_PSEVA|nr:hypothetical protein [Pseudomonas vancouverensis]KAB0490641.1 hypothetical protein F7R09_27200 [Pseudomonas vancouverensis]TDB62904.1 hypothetical protein EIY72_13510 [Pseudomonas vancouverensis]SDU92335.1 hypothetical protein SAMN05216558_0737 [Pseudomonas vancouverensis]
MPKLISDNNTYSSDPLVRTAVLSLVIATSLLLCFRMTLGVDLTDESYYLSFVDGWLKTGFHDSSALVIHQTAEFLVFPFVKIFFTIYPDENGLALFNRYLYLSLSLLSGFCFFYFARTRQTFTISALCGVAVTSFIPFSLPAPSYNTIGMLGMLCAIACYATFIETRKHTLLLISAASWAVSALAYPTLVVVLASFLTVIVAVPTLRPTILRYSLWCLLFQVLGLGLLLSVYGENRLMQIVEFTNASLQVSSGLGGKVSRAYVLLSASYTFVALCLGSIAVGVVAGMRIRHWTHGWLTASLITGVLVTARLTGPVLYATSHDYVFLLAITGTAFFITASITRTHNDSALTGYFLVGLFAGLVTSLTATNSIVNFAVGGFISTCILLLSALPKDKIYRKAHTTLVCVVSAFFLLSNFEFIYGESTDLLSSKSANRIERGVFAGLVTTKEKAEAITETSAFLAKIPGESIAAIGRFPSIYLLTRMRPQTLSTWDFSQQNGTTPKIDSAISEFYSFDKNLPSVVLNVTDPWTRPPSNSALQLLTRYVKTSHIETNLWRIEIYVKPSTVR